VEYVAGDDMFSSKESYSSSSIITFEIEDIFFTLEPDSIHPPAATTPSEVSEPPSCTGSPGVET
jgi:hypothetical protein